MRAIFPHAISLALLAIPACSDDDGGDDEAGDAADGAEGGEDGSTIGPDPCTVGCEATLVADCPGGPESLVTCEMDCQELLAGECATEYRAFIACSRGRDVTCDANGLPTVVACDIERTAFVACLAGG